MAVSYQSKHADTIGLQGVQWTNEWGFRSDPPHRLHP